MTYGIKLQDQYFRRNERNKLLLDTDKYLLPDYPITPENLIIIKQYRQSLRDYMETIDEEPFPDLPEFPF
jgi:hypothetical protein